MFRVIANNDKLQYWKTRNCSEQMSSILNPDDSDIDEDFDVKTCCTCDTGQIGVKKSGSKIRWGKLTSSRYHTKCFNNNNTYKNSKKKPNKKVKLKRNIMTKICEPEKCQGSAEKLQKFVNECYCYYPPKKPLLPAKLSAENLVENLEQQYKSFHSLETLRKAKPLLEYCPETEFLQKIRKEAKDFYSCDCGTCKIKSFIDKLKYSKNRNDLEKAYKRVESTIFDYGDSDLILSDTQKTNKENDNKVDEILNDPQKLKTVKDFRDKNYFETHSAKDLAPCGVPAHKCIHKFTVDERLLPKPVNTDVFGNSRCTICSKIVQQQNDNNKDSSRKSSAKTKTNTIKAPTYDVNDEFLSEYSGEATTSKTKHNLEYLMAPKNNRKVFRDSNNNKKPQDLKIQISQLINDTPKKPPNPPRRISNTIIIEQDESELITRKNSTRRPTLTVYNTISPRKITIGGNDDIIELQITPSLLSTNNQPVKIQKNRIPRDSFALRYQKGVV